MNSITTLMIIIIIIIIIIIMIIVIIIMVMNDRLVAIHDSMASLMLRNTKQRFETHH